MVEIDLKSGALEQLVTMPANKIEELKMFFKTATGLWELDWYNAERADLKQLEFDGITPIDLRNDQVVRFVTSAGAATSAVWVEKLKAWRLNTMIVSLVGAIRGSNWKRFEAKTSIAGKTLFNNASSNIPLFSWVTKDKDRYAASPSRMASAFPDMVFIAMQAKTLTGVGADTPLSKVLKAGGMEIPIFCGGLGMLHHLLVPHGVEPRVLEETALYMAWILSGKVVGKYVASTTQTLAIHKSSVEMWRQMVARKESLMVQIPRLCRRKEDGGLEFVESIPRELVEKINAIKGLQVEKKPVEMIVREGD